MATANDELTAARYDSAMLGSVHAAISASDAVTVALIGRRSTDADHRRAADLLADATTGMRGVDQRIQQLRWLLDRKNLVEYEPRRATAEQASDGVRRAEHFVRWANDVVAQARV